MPTKDELIDENAELRAKVAELEADSGGVLDDGLYVYNQGVGMTLAGEVAGVYTYDGEEAVMLWDGEYRVRVRAADGTFAAPETDGVYRYDGSGDFVAVDLDAAASVLNEIALINEIGSVKTQRDEARNEVARLKERLKNSTALHGSVDDLPVPY